MARFTSSRAPRAQAPALCHGRIMGENGLAGGGQDRGSRVFGNAQESLRRLLPAEEQLIGTMLTVFRQRGWMKRCVIGTTPTRMFIVPIRLDGSAKGPHIEIQGEDVLEWRVDGIGL